MYPRNRMAALLCGLVLATSACGGTNAVSDQAAETTPIQQDDEATTSVAETPAVETPASATEADDPGASSTESALDQQLFEAVASIYSTFRGSETAIWEADYRFEQKPLVVPVRDGRGEVQRTYSFNHPDGPSLPGATKVDLDPDLQLGDVYQIDTPQAALEAPGAPFLFDAQVGTISTMMVFVDPADSNLNPESAFFRRLLVHEMFHRHQLVDAQWAPGSPIDTAAYTRDNENAALALLEDQILLSIVESAGDIDEVRRLLGQFVAVRSTRDAAFGMGAHDRAQELGEGTARYVENRYAEAAGDDGEWSAASAASRPELAWLSWTRFYESGAMLGFALDELDIDWRQAAADGLAQADVAAAAVEIDNLEQAVADAKEEFDFESIVATVEAADLSNAEAFRPGGEGNTGSGSISEEAAIACLSGKGIEVSNVDELQALDFSDSAISDALGECIDAAS